MGKYVVVFSGHRDVPLCDRQAIRDGIKKAMEEADELVIGGAIGADDIALEAAWEFKTLAMQDCPDSKAAKVEITIIVAGTLADQPWEARKRLRWHQETGTSVKIIELGLEYVAKNLLHRNRVMLDRAAFPNKGKLLMYWRGDQKGGTWSAYAYARKMQLAVENTGCGELLPEKKTQGTFGF